MNNNIRNKQSELFKKLDSRLRAVNFSTNKIYLRDYKNIWITRCNRSRNDELMLKQLEAELERVTNADALNFLLEFGYNRDAGATRGEWHYY